MMRDEHVFHRLRRNRLGGLHNQMRAARVIGVHNDQVIFHLNDDRVGIAHLIGSTGIARYRFAFAKPDTGSDLFQLARLRASRRGEREQNAKGYELRKYCWLVSHCQNLSFSPNSSERPGPEALTAPKPADGTPLASK